MHKRSLERELLPQGSLVVFMSLSLIVIMIKKAISQEKPIESKQATSPTK